MKKFLLLLCFALISSFAFGQYHNSGQSPFSFSIVGGASIAYFQVKSTATSVISNDPEGVGCLGASFGYKFNDYFSISPALLLSGKGGQTEGLYGSYNEDIASKYELYYLEGSLSFIGHIPVDTRANIFFGGGPFYANGLFGRNKNVDYDYWDGKSVHFGKSGEFKSNDYGVASLIGFESESGYTFSISFDLGLTNIHQFNPSSPDNDQLKTRSFYFGIGHSF